MRWIFHNCVAHPMLVIWPRVGRWLHDRTAPGPATNLTRKAMERDEPLDEVMHLRRALCDIQLMAVSALNRPIPAVDPVPAPEPVKPPGRKCVNSAGDCYFSSDGRCYMCHVARTPAAEPGKPATCCDVFPLYGKHRGGCAGATPEKGGR